MPSGYINQHVDVREREIVFRACFIQVDEINIDSPLPVPLSDYYYVHLRVSWGIVPLKLIHCSVASEILH